MERDTTGYRPVKIQIDLKRKLKMLAAWNGEPMQDVASRVVSRGLRDEMPSTPALTGTTGE